VTACRIRRKRAEIDSANGGVNIWGMVVALPVGKTLISTAEAAKLLGVSMGRVRQLGLLGAKQGGLTRYWAAPTALVFDEAEVKQRAKDRPKTGKTGRPAGGFARN